MKNLLAALMVATIFSTLSRCPLAQADETGEIALVTGTVESQKGELLFAEPQPGSLVKVNPFSQYRGSDKQTRAEVKWFENAPRRVLKLKDRIGVGEVVETGASGRVRVFLNDDSIVDIGPNTLLSIQKFEMNEQNRHIILRMLKGKARVLVVRKLPGRSFYQLTTPGVLVSVRGTDFIAHTDLSGDQAQTHVLGVRGQVTCDLVRNAKGGEVYTQPIVVNTYSHLRVTSADGYALDYELKDKIPMEPLLDLWDKHAPFTDPLASLLGAHPTASTLPGTGVERTNRPKPNRNRRTESGLVAELEAEHPQIENEGLTPSENFKWPSELELETTLVNYKLGPYPKLLGPNQVDRLPYERLRVVSPEMTEQRPQ